MSDPSRPDPERLLHQMLEQEEHQRRGQLKIFLGYSSGVGKSYRMFDEARRRLRRGQDVVVGATQQRNAPEVEALLQDLEVMPTRAGALDVEALVRRHPEICLVDGLAHGNPEGSQRAHRWQDLEVLRAAGINVIATVNLQFITEQRLAVERISGRAAAAADTVPEAFLRSADEIELVDAPPEDGPALDPENQRRRQTLSELRELALLLAADVVEHQLADYLRRNGLEPSWGTQERILVCLGSEDARLMLESGRRNADRFHGELLAVHVDGRRHDRGLQRNLERARALGAEVHLLAGPGLVNPLLEFARRHRVTQIFIGHAGRGSWRSRLTGSPVEHLIRRAEGVDIRVFPRFRSGDA